jgi:hypothetical protein
MASLLTERPQSVKPETVGSAQRAQERQAAVRYLLAAATTDDVVKRNSLRRRAAELVLPR